MSMTIIRLCGRPGPGVTYIDQPLIDQIPNLIISCRVSTYMNCRLVVANFTNKNENRLG